MSSTAIDPKKESSLVSFCDYSIHPYNEQAARVYASFSTQIKRVGSQDCRIAASAIAAGWIVVTANRKDFCKFLAYSLRTGAADIHAVGMNLVFALLPFLILLLLPQN